MVRVHADVLLLQVERVLARVDGLQLVRTLQRRPPPQSTVDDVRKALPVRYLQSSVQRARNDDALGRLLAFLRDGLLQVSELLRLRSLEFLDERLDGFFRPRLLLLEHDEAHQTLHDRRREREKR